jgi:hypothetical protein
VGVKVTVAELVAEGKAVTVGWGAAREQPASRRTVVRMKTDRSIEKNYSTAVLKTIFWLRFFENASNQ